MASAVIFMQWDSYAGTADTPGVFSRDPLTFNSRQERLHRLAPGDRLWLVSRSPDNRQYFCVAVLTIAALKRNPPDSTEGQLFGEFAIVADRSQSHDLGRRFPAEGLLRALQFEKGQPIKHGASIGQSLQTLRILDEMDERVLDTALRRILNGEEGVLDVPFGLWTKCDRVFADYFLRNWTERRRPLAFLLYDSPPALLPGAPVFVHSDKHLRLIARFRESQFISGQKYTVDEAERLAERDRIWTTWRADTLDPPARSDFDEFWQRQNGVRALCLIDEVTELPQPSQFKEYARALEWGYPTGVGYRYLTLSQTYLLLRQTQLAAAERNLYLEPLLA